MKNTVLTTIISISLVAAFGSTKIANIVNKDLAPKYNFEAFTNLAKNIQKFQSANLKTYPQEVAEKPEIQVIDSIDREIVQKIKTQKKLIVNSISKKNNTIEKYIIADKPVAVAAKKIKNIVKQEKNESVELKKNIEDLSRYEINNSELITEFGFKFENKFVKSQAINLSTEISENNETIIDNVSMTSASTKNEIKKDAKKVDEVVSKEKEALLASKEDDLSVFDYPARESAPERNIDNNLKDQNFDKLLYERPISDTVKSAINREIKNNKTNVMFGSMNFKNGERNQPKANNLILNESNSNEDQVVFDYSSVKKGSKNNNEVGFINEKNSTQVLNKFSAKINIIYVNLNTQKNQLRSSYEFIPDYDRNERVYDNNTGEISVEYSTSNEEPTISGILSKAGAMPTRVEITSQERNNIIPVFDEENYNEFRAKNNIVMTNSIIVAIGNEIVDAEIDSNYDKKIFLNKNYRPSETDKKYILFAGVRSGNILIKYRLPNNDDAQKIIYVGENEIYYDNSSFISGERESFELTTRSLMSTKLQELNVSGESLKVFNTNITSKKNTLNSYEIKMPTHIYGARKYLELKHQGNSVFIGTQKDHSIEIPQADFVQKILEFNKVSLLDQRCLVQLNLSKDVSEIKSSGKNANGEMFVETSYLDSQGQLSGELSEQVQKIFLMGEDEGTISLNIEYSDGTTENMKTLCSNGTFLIEQL